MPQDKNKTLYQRNRSILKLSKASANSLHEDDCKLENATKPSALKPLNTPFP